MSSPREIRVFIASPNDLQEERRRFSELIDELNAGFGAGANVQFVPLAWEETLSHVGRRSQEVINQEIDTCHVFVIAMYRRWGQDAADTAYSSYTEEEFHRAMERFKKTGEPEIFIFFRNVDPGQIADPGEQLKKVLAFRRQIEESPEIWPRYFDDPDGFRREVNEHLRAFVRGELPKRDRKLEAILLPLEALKKVKQAEAAAEQARAEAEAAKREGEAHQAKLLKLKLALAQQAAKAARDGRIEEARQLFPQSLEGNTDFEVQRLGFEFYYRTGELNEAELLMRQAFAMMGPNSKSPNAADAWRYLGWLSHLRGDLDEAEKMHRTSLEINQLLRRKEGIARDYGNLGLIYRSRGDLNEAEQLHRKSLAFNEQLGNRKGMASEYGNLGLVYKERKDLDEAERLQRKALEINLELGSQEGVAIAYGNLGVIYEARGDLDEAERLQRASLEINSQLNRPRGIAIAYGNLGLIYKKRDDLDEAERLLQKSLEINRQLGNKDGISEAYGVLGLIYQSRGNLAEAEGFFRSSLAIDEQRGNWGGIAETCENLGDLYQARNEPDKAERMRERATEIRLRHR